MGCGAVSTLLRWLPEGIVDKLVVFVIFDELDCRIFYGSRMLL
jgi:hypothetical protein